ncbi:transcriptional regulator with XRE-family HTH domain [Aureimonas pseudogalii]|uniref:Transcriptional regulator with XRE-family HTH domain n=1 Tax=Aureimonas pseudogalii TaxID=1744844 RepID=A0A7W6H390_9HYPH|nr:transcriptional regulator with XRE-family HTH domain [Aureimonas pseudogalii]
MSQEKLGEHLGITFQQIQKYEKGTNRIGASRLQKISEVMAVPVSFFFDGLSDLAPAAVGFSEPSAEFVNDFTVSSESVQLNRAFTRIADPKVRRRIVDLVRSLADAAPDVAPELEPEREPELEPALPTTDGS